MRKPRIVITAGFYALSNELWAPMIAHQTMSETLPANASVERMSEVMNDLRAKVQKKYLLDEPYIGKFQQLTFGAPVLRDTIICDVAITTEVKA